MFKTKYRIRKTSPFNFLVEKQSWYSSKWKSVRLCGYYGEAVLVHNIHKYDAVIATDGKPPQLVE